MSAEERLRKIAELRDKAHNAPRSLPGSPSTAFSRFAREYSNALREHERKTREEKRNG